MKFIVCLKKILSVFVRVLIRIIPRNYKLIVYGGAMDKFIDNTKYMFIYNNIHMPEYRHVWLTNDESVLEKIHKLNFDGIKSNSLKGFFIIVSAGYVIFDNRISDFTYYDFSEGAVRINIWHGVFFKMLGATKKDIDSPYRVKFRFVERYLFEHQKGDYGICTTRNMKNKYSYAFKLPVDKIIVSGYPRNRILLLNEKERYDFIEKYEDNIIKELYKNNAKSSLKKIIYMPTFRDNDPNYIYKAILDWDLLNQSCVSNNVLLFIKVHRMTPLPEINGFSNIILLDSKIDVYPLLPTFDILITDYSSIMFDFSILNKPIILYTFDMESYIYNSRHILMSIWNVFKDKVPIVSDFDSFISVFSMSIKEGNMFPTDYFFDYADNIEPINRIIKNS